MGAVYCSNIAVAAVVSLFAITNSATVPTYAKAPPILYLLNLRLGFFMIIAAIRLRIPAIAIAFHWMDLISKPPVLHSKEAIIRYNIDLNRSFLNFSNIEPISDNPFSYSLQ